MLHNEEYVFKGTVVFGNGKMVQILRVFAGIVKDRSSDPITDMVKMHDMFFSDIKSPC